MVFAMRTSGIWPLLLLTIFVVAALPLGAAFYFADRALQTSLDLGFNDSILRTLQADAENLKTLGRLDPAGEARYRTQFESVERLTRIYSSPGLLKERLLDSLKIYFGLGLVAVVLLSVTLAALLSRGISRSYDATFQDLISHKERVRYLEEMATWQQLARMLAHEIKNPLTPIEVLVTSLSRSYATQPADEFSRQLQQTQMMIEEELNHLKSTVNKFSEFAALPAVHLVGEDLPTLLEKLVQSVSLGFERADIEVQASASAPPLRARVDRTLLRQVLTNIIRNGLEANPHQRVRFSITLAAEGSSLKLLLANDGQPVQHEFASRIFEPYVSGTGGRDNMGLGLAIVRKIIIEHGGDITYAELGGRPVFTITLPRDIQ
jgi:signal transduction histidine kinase